MGKQVPRCEDCVYFDVEDEYGNEGCQLNLDQDEVYVCVQEHGQNVCRYFRPYDEYKSVQKQN